MILTCNKYGNSIVLQYAESLSKCQPVTNDSNYLYMMMFHSAGDPPLQDGTDVHSYAIVTSWDLLLENNDIKLYHGTDELSVTVHRLDEPIVFKSEELELATNFHYTLFDKILCLKGAHLEADYFKSSLKRYLVIPVTILAGYGNVTGIIDYDLMREVVQNNCSVKWPCSPAEYNNALVSVNHRSDIDQVTQSHRLYNVTRVCTDKSPRSPFPDAQWKTFQDFYHSKYNYNFNYPDQPLLEVTYASARLDHLTPRQSHSSVGEEMTRKTQELFPEFCEVQPLSSEMYKLARFLPSLFYRLESMLSAHELITEVNSSSHDEFTSPSNSLVMQALTLQGAQDCFNMERLELLGDTFLKMITTVFLFSTLPATASVSVITHKRSNMFSNVRLYFLAMNKSIPSKIKSTVFKARSMWLPPGYRLNEGDVRYEQFVSQMIPDKRVADCAEALVGAYILEGGITAGVKFLEWLEFFKIHHSSTMARSLLSDHPLDILLASGVLEKYFSSTCAKRPSATAEVEKKLFAGLQQFDRLWTFQDKYILLEAMTHISYTYNRATGSYQRLELLGDAILDYLITSYIYCSCPDYDEGQVSLLRSALVSNTTLALIAVINSFHKAVKHNSPKLFSKIQQFTSADVVRQLITKDPSGGVVLYTDNELVY